MRLGFKEDMLVSCCEEALKELQKEPEEQDILVRSIKNFTREKKAEQQYLYSADLFDEDTPLHPPSSVP